VGTTKNLWFNAYNGGVKYAKLLKYGESIDT